MLGGLEKRAESFHLGLNTVSLFPQLSDAASVHERHNETLLFSAGLPSWGWRKLSVWLFISTTNLIRLNSSLFLFMSHLYRYDDSKNAQKLCFKDSVSDSPSGYYCELFSSVSWLDRRSSSRPKKDQQMPGCAVIGGLEERAWQLKAPQRRN